MGEAAAAVFTSQLPSPSISELLGWPSLIIPAAPFQVVHLKDGGQEEQMRTACYQPASPDLGRVRVMLSSGSGSGLTVKHCSNVRFLLNFTLQVEVL